MSTTDSIRPWSASEPPENRALREHIEALTEHGYIVGVRCHSCGAILTAQRSVALTLGPVCRGRMEAGRG